MSRTLLWPCDYCPREFTTARYRNQHETRAHARPAPAEPDQPSSTTLVDEDQLPLWRDPA